MLLKYFYWTLLFYNLLLCEANNSKEQTIEKSIRQYGNDGVGITYYPLGLNAGKEPSTFYYDGKNLNYLGYPQFEKPISHRVVKKATATKKTKKAKNQPEPKLEVKLKSLKKKTKRKENSKCKKNVDINFSKKVFAHFTGNLKDGLKSKVTANFNDNKNTTGTAKDMMKFLKKVSELFKSFGKKSKKSRVNSEITHSESTNSESTNSESTNSESKSSDKETTKTSTPKPPPCTTKSSIHTSTSLESKSKSKSSESKTSSSTSESNSSSGKSKSSKSFLVRHYKRIQDIKHKPLGILKADNKLHPFDTNTSKYLKNKNLKPLYLKNVKYDEVKFPHFKYSHSDNSDLSTFWSESFDFSSLISDTKSYSSYYDSSLSSENFSFLSIDMSKYDKYHKYTKHQIPHDSSSSQETSRCDGSKLKLKLSKYETYKQPKISLLKLHQRSVPKNQITIVPRSTVALEKTVEAKGKIDGENKEVTTEKKLLEVKDRVKRNEYRLRGHYESHTGQPFGHFTDLKLPHVAAMNNFR